MYVLLRTMEVSDANGFVQKKKEMLMEEMRKDKKKKLETVG